MSAIERSPNDVHLFSLDVSFCRTEKSDVGRRDLDTRSCRDWTGDCEGLQGWAFLCGKSIAASTIDPALFDTRAVVATSSSFKLNVLSTHGILKRDLTVTASVKSLNSSSCTPSLTKTL